MWLQVVCVVIAQHTTVATPLSSCRTVTVVVRRELRFSVSVGGQRYDKPVVERRRRRREDSRRANECREEIASQGLCVLDCL